jgi:hypothetical protein
MTRRCWIAITAALAACGKQPRAIDVFPQTIGPWRRTSLREPGLGETSDPVPQSSVRRVQAATYEGPGKLEARAYELTSSAVGLELAQRWRPSADTVFFWAKQYFVVVNWQEASRKALQEFTSTLEKRLNQ